MEILMIVLFVIGGLYTIFALTDSSFVYDNPKSRLFIKWMKGKKNFKIFLFVLGVTCLVAAFLIKGSL